MADDLNEKKRRRKDKIERKHKKARTCSKKAPGYNVEIFRETDYYIKNGLRFVKPYFFTFSTHCKGRWLQRKLHDVMSQEFQSETAEYYKKAIEIGNITVNGNQVNKDFILQNNDLIQHKVHRHEPPVTSEKIQIISQKDDIIVVNKPSSIPIHPCGRYRHNSLVFLLGREFGFVNLYTIHRIDRLTSGIVIFSKTLTKAQELERQLREHELKKEYLCKVKGEFPSDVIRCEEPIVVVSHKVGVCRVHKEGKPCTTVFKRQHYDGKNSIVKCEPLTGRMHQIRVHLQWLGFPIVDDPLYNHVAWGDDRGKGGVEDENVWKVIDSIATALRDNDVTQIIHSNVDSKRITKGNGIDSNTMASKEDINVTDTMTSKEDINVTDTMTSKEDINVTDTMTSKEDINVTDRNMKTSKRLILPINLLCWMKANPLIKLTENLIKAQNEHKRIDERKELENPTAMIEDEKIPGCTECQINRANPKPWELTMCLHAAVYKGPDWEYRAPWPKWALWKESNT
ncbi:RNA pseudouridylate synthase domain-containing protein 2-like [Xenia sp. Carnegie-2017]|uniref:RNA pseudouridylate synthase domain-containing protein 2-like n=1 Tax=Xenia sp. Carnegie-2017 TaxID=2897299 RepID=UPI001F04BB35|nr:RNA pseudouridylate synthase domain-containing protein 2-like [Xenia sp. Carnegie-2017]